MKRFVILLMCLAVISCDESMDKQNKLKTEGEAPKGGWPAAGEALPRVPGTVALDDLDRDAALRDPPPVSADLLQRGRERYDIYCAACHGLAGAGNGIVVARGFPKPAPFTDPAVMQSSARHLVDVIGDGARLMYGFADRVEPRDRWAITAYIRALQVAAIPR
jgi:mono/diheme cytochrome c family protein